MPAGQQVFIFLHDEWDDPGYNYTLTLSFVGARPPPPSPPPSPRPPSATSILALALGTSAAANSTTAGLPNLGQLASPDGIFGYTAPFTGLLTVSVCPSGWDSVVHVLGADGSLLAENDNATVVRCAGSKVSG